MKIYLSAVEQHFYPYMQVIKEKGNTLWNLISYYYADIQKAETIRKTSKSVLIDSGAHTLQKIKKVDFEEYTERYASFIKQFDDEKCVGYFEMDVDNIIGYKNVLELRKKLEKVSNKIIPVWHRNRGVEEYKRMCQEYAGKWISITGFKNEDIKDEQYLMFLKYAKKFGCKVHCLGMTRKQVLDKVPFDSVDSSSWVQQAVRGKVKGVQTPKGYRNYDYMMKENYKEFMELQEYYYLKWRRMK